MFSRFGPPVTLILMVGPVLAGLIGTILPAFGYLPALGGTQFSLTHFQAFWAVPGIWQSTCLSFFSGLTATLLALVIVLGFFAAASQKTVRRIQHIVSPLLSVPHAAAAFGFAFMIAPSGFIARMISPELTGWARPPDWLIVNDPYAIALILGLAAKEVPFLLLVTLAALPQIKVQEQRHLTQAMGYGTMSGFVFGTWPQIYAQIRLAVFAVLAFSTSVVDVALILGPTVPPVLSIRLLEWMTDPDLNTRFVAAAGALMQLALTLSALLFWLGLERAGRMVLQFLTHSGWRFRHDKILKTLSLSAVVTTSVILFGGLLGLIIWSFAGLWRFPDLLPQSFSLRTWSSILPQLGAPLQTTLAVGLLSALVATVLAVLCLTRENAVRHQIGTQSALQKNALWLIYLPLIVPQAAFLFGLQFLFISLHADGMLLTLVVAHLVFVLPYVFLSLSDPWRAMDRRFEAVAISLGQSPARVFWKVRLPMMLRVILAAFALGFAVSAGQYLATILAGAGRLTTLTTEAVALSSGGNRRIIGVYALMQMVLPALMFMVATALPALYFRNQRAMRV